MRWRKSCNKGADITVENGLQVLESRSSNRIHYDSLSGIVSRSNVQRTPVRLSTTSNFSLLTCRGDATAAPSDPTILLQRASARVFAPAPKAAEMTIFQSSSSSIKPFVFASLELATTRLLAPSPDATSRTRFTASRHSLDDGPVTVVRNRDSTVDISSHLILLSRMRSTGAREPLRRELIPPASCCGSPRYASRRRCAPPGRCSTSCARQ